MRNVHVGTITGIPIRLNITFLLFLPVLAWLISRPTQLAAYAGFVAAISPHEVDIALLQSGTTPIVVGIAAAVGLFVGVLLHELGHSWTARRYDITIVSITLWIFGGMAHMEDLPEDWDVEFYVALAGPAMSVLVAAVCYGLLFVVPAQPVVVFVIGWLAVINLTLAVFNMLPAFPMDGGRVLRALLARSRPYADATRTAAAVGKGMAILLAVLAVLAFAPILLLVAMFVYVAAGAESRATVMRDLLADMTARDLMSTDIRTVTPETTVAEFLDRVVTERTTAYPVMDKGTVTGLVTLNAVRTVDPAKRASTTVADVMGPAPPSVDPETDAFEALNTLGQSRSDRVLVIEREAAASEGPTGETPVGGRFVGQITAEDFLAAIEVLQGIGSRRDLEVPDGYA
jgi:Zn-dependent protease